MKKKTISSLFILISDSFFAVGNPLLIKFEDLLIIDAMRSIIKALSKKKDMAFSWIQVLKKSQFSNRYEIKKMRSDDFFNLSEWKFNYKCGNYYRGLEKPRKILALRADRIDWNENFFRSQNCINPNVTKLIMMWRWYTVLFLIHYKVNF